VDRLELFLEIELALILKQRAAHILVDLPFQLEQIDLAREHVAERAKESRELVDGQQRLPSIEPHAEVRRDPERLPRRRLGALDDRHQLGREPPVQRDVLLEQ